MAAEHHEQSNIYMAKLRSDMVHLPDKIQNAEEALHKVTTRVRGQTFADLNPKYASDVQDHEAEQYGVKPKPKRKRAPLPPATEEAGIPGPSGIQAPKVRDFKEAKRRLANKDGKNKAKGGKQVTIKALSKGVDPEELRAALLLVKKSKKTQ